MSLKGCQTTIKLGTNNIAGLNSANFDAVLDQLDVTDFDSNCTREFIPGLSGATFTLSGDYKPTDINGQAVLVDAWKNKTLLTGATQPAFLVDGTNGFGADAYVSAMSVGSTPDGKVTVNFTLQCTGAISILS